MQWKGTAGESWMRRLISWVITYSQEAGQFTSLWEFLKRFNQIHPSTFFSKYTLYVLAFLHVSCKEDSYHNDCFFLVVLFWLFGGLGFFFYELSYQLRH